MAKKRLISLLYPNDCEVEYKQLSDVTIHDLGFDLICREVTEEKSEQEFILSILSKMTMNPAVTKYRCEIFEDICENPELRNQLMEILDKINFLREYGSVNRPSEEKASTWDLLHRLDELKDYIQCVEAIYECLSEISLKSQGLIQLKEYVQRLYSDNGFGELKKDIMNLKATTSDLKSVTLGVNLTESFEVDGIGLVSVNKKHFTKSNIVGNFYDAIVSKGNIQADTEWKENYRFHPITENESKYAEILAHMERMNMMMINPIAAVSMGDPAKDFTRYISDIADHMLSGVVKKLRSVLNKYVTITITDITDLIPEFIYYIRWYEYIEKLREKGNSFCKASLAEASADERIMQAKGIYNLKLAAFATENHDEIVANDLDFNKEHLVYILTGANRGGKTTITQAVGQLFVLAQGGIFVPGEEFIFQPVDCVYTHFPADEDKTMDLGRLGEECKRFRDIYYESTRDSLLLLNETFSTTSFEEGYFIARDSVKAILSKGVRTIYNTHMHKLAFDIDEMNKARDDLKIASLVMKSDGGNRSYKVAIGAPEGMSYANDIAKKYGVTFDMLTNNKLDTN